MRVFAFTLLVFASAAGAALADAVTSTAPTPAPRPAPAAPIVGFHAPEFSLVTTDGKTITLHDLRGRVVVVNFFASWCEPCQREMPMLSIAAKQFASNPVSFVGIDYAEGGDLLHRFQRRYQAIANLDYPLLSDDGGDVGHDYDVESIPHTFILTGDGLVAYSHLGVLNVPGFLAALQAVMNGNDAAASAGQKAEREAAYTYSVQSVDAAGAHQVASGYLIVGIMSVMHGVSGARFAMRSPDPEAQISAVGTIGPDGALDFGSRKLDHVAQALLPFFAQGVRDHAGTAAGNGWSTHASDGRCVCDANYVLTGVSGSNAAITVQANYAPPSQPAWTSAGIIQYDQTSHVPMSGTLTLRSTAGGGATTLTFAQAR